MNLPLATSVPTLGLRTLAGIVFLVGAANAQSTLQLFKGDAADDKFGRTVAGLGDVNGDGLPDVIIGADGDDNNGPYSGSVRVHNARNGNLIHVLDGRVEDAFFGGAVDSAGDIDRDGRDDFIVGAIGLGPGGTFFAGAATIYSGRDGHILRTLTGSQTADFFGRAVAGVGDVNGDGYPDVIVGADGDDTGNFNGGAARIFSGKTGAVLHTFVGLGESDALGAAVAGAGDVDRDGFPDVIVGSFLADGGGEDAGMAQVFSGKTGVLLHTFLGAAAGDELGAALAGAGDVNRDGYADLIVGAPGASSDGFEGNGCAYVFSGRDGSLLWQFRGKSDLSGMGSAVDGAGDFDGDGRADLLVGAPQAELNGERTGAAYVFSGLSGIPLLVAYGTSEGDLFGAAVSGLGDANGDGKLDIAVGAWGDDDNGPSSGTVRVISGVDLCVYSSATAYCVTRPNSSGAPAAIHFEGSLNVNDESLVLIATSLPPREKGLFLYSLGRAGVPFGDGQLCVSSSTLGYILRTPLNESNGVGVLRQVFDFEFAPSSVDKIRPGETWNFQALFRDAGGPQGFNLSDALEITFCP